MIKHSFKLIWNQKLKNTYIILELFFLFVILLISSVYMIEKYELYAGGTGAEIDNMFHLRINQKDFKDVDFIERLVALRKEVLSNPEVEQVSFSQNAIPYIWSMSMNTSIYDSVHESTVLRGVDENFGRIFQLEMIAGKWFEDDYQSANTPVVIDRKLAEALFDSPEDAISKIIDNNGDKLVVGVYEMLKRNEYEENYSSLCYPRDFSSTWSADMVVKYKDEYLANPSQLAKTIHLYFNKEEFAIRYASTMNAKKQDVVAETNIEMTMVGFFAVFLIVNIILGMIGIFGYSVKRRKGELGIRRAMGSSAQKLYLLLLLESWSLTILALIPAIILMIQIPLLDLYPVETHIFLQALGLSVLLIFVLVSMSVYYPAYLASKIEAAEALSEE
ncbi:FtsX-like permease family protein [Lentimicrobium sp. L6]|uniref:ABC transporter permease n=1 Tax=Lentimicrobium sp. L6 TaxID=2735916 RepID=UPI001555539C|nr:FtsX-like permease family protein [Lentimicrobium sp. L6]NPD84632.1 FtsX-like permease family protein [Lentimicrobium sp. L6]